MVEQRTENPCVAGPIPALGNLLLVFHLQMKKHWLYPLIALLACSYTGFSIAATSNAEQSFIVKPYLQLGNHPDLQQDENLDLLWITSGNQDAWNLSTKNAGKSQWQQQQAPRKVILSYSVPEKLYLWDNAINGLSPGQKFEYKLSKDGKEVFRGNGVARKNSEQSYRFVLFGDTGADTLSERKIVYQTYLKKPDFVVILGDIAYSYGRLSEYLAKFFPMFSNDKAAAELGAPLLQSTVVVRCDRQS